MTLNVKSWLASIVLLTASGVTMAQEAPSQNPIDFTLSDNGNNNVPALITDANGTPFTPCMTSELGSYDLFEKNIDSVFISNYLATLLVPDKSAVSAASNDVLVRFTNGANISSGLVTCDGGTVTRNANPLVYKVNLSTDNNCKLIANSSDGKHAIEGILFKTGTGADTTYAVADGKCTYDANSSSAPTVVNIKRKTPTADTTTDSVLVWTVQFSEDVTDVDGADFEITGATGMSITVVSAADSGSFGYEVSAAQGDFTTSGQAAFLKLTANNDIKERNGSQQGLSSTTPTGSNDNYYCYQSCTSGATTSKGTKVETDKGVLTSLKEEDSTIFTTGKPDNMNFDLGTYSYKIESLSTTTAETATITLTLTNDVPADAKIYKITNNGYTELGSTNNLVISGKTITFEIVDNGSLDADTVLGTISDPVTIGTPTSTTTTSTNSSPNATAVSSGNTTPSTTSSGSGSFGIMGVLFGSALFGLAAYRRRARMQ